jgi:hypothetical protein
MSSLSKRLSVRPARLDSRAAVGPATCTASTHPRPGTTHRDSTVRMNAVLSDVRFRAERHRASDTTLTRDVDG